MSLLILTTQSRLDDFVIDCTYSSSRAVNKFEPFDQYQTTYISSLFFKYL